MVDKATIEQRIKGRESFKTLLEMFLEGNPTEAAIQGFQREALAYAQEHIGVVEKDVQMDEKASAEHEQEVVGYGKYADLRWIDVPFDYLEGFADRAKQFLRWYHSDRVQRRIQG